MGELTDDVKGEQLDLSEAEPMQADVSVLRHNWEHVTHINGKGIETPRLNCKNPGCDKQNKPVFVRALSKICKKGRPIPEKFGASAF